MKKLLFFLFILLLYSNICLAHKLSIFAYVEDGKLFISSYFVDGTPCKKCSVIVFQNGKEVLSAKTDNQGEFVTKMIWDLPLKIEVEGSLGHKGTFVMEKEETDSNSVTMNKQSVKEQKCNMQKIMEMVDARINKKLKLIKIYVGIASLFGFFGIVALFKKR